MNGECDSCNLFHLNSGLPYAWQYYGKDSWKMFDACLNAEMEKAFCDPSKDTFE